MTNDNLLHSNVCNKDPNNFKSLTIASINARGTFYTHLHLYVEKIKLVNTDIILIQDAGSIKSTFLLKKEGFSIHSNCTPPGDKAGALAIVIKSTLAYLIQLKIPYPLSWAIELCMEASLTLFLSIS